VPLFVDDVSQVTDVIAVLTKEDEMVADEFAKFEKSSGV